MAMRAALQQLALGACLLAAPLGCKDPGLIGAELAPVELECEPACAADRTCDRTRGECVPCTEDDGCAPPPRLDAGACTRADCAECTDGDQCGDDAPMCVAGRCVECAEDSDCDGEGERACEDGSCIVVERDDGSGGDDDEESGDDI